MDYIKIYDRLVNSRVGNPPFGYKEYHHILPKCLGGSDDPSNLVALTAREHVIAHLLLSRAYPGNRDLNFSAWAMCMSYDGVIDRPKINSRTYQSLREAQSKHQADRMKEKWSDGAYKERVSNSLKKAWGKPDRVLRYKESREAYEAEHGKTWGSRDFSLLSPEGDLIQGNNVAKFCRERGLNSDAISLVLTKKQSHHKGWKLPP